MSVSAEKTRLMILNIDLLNFDRSLVDLGEITRLPVPNSGLRAAKTMISAISSGASAVFPSCIHQSAAKQKLA